MDEASPDLDPDLSPAGPDPAAEFRRPAAESNAGTDSGGGSDSCCPDPSDLYPDLGTGSAGPEGRAPAPIAGLPREKDDEAFSPDAAGSSNEPPAGPALPVGDAAEAVVRAGMYDGGGRGAGATLLELEREEEATSVVGRGPEPDPTAPLPIEALGDNITAGFSGLRMRDSHDCRRGAEEGGNCPCCREGGSLRRGGVVRSDGPLDTPAEATDSTAAESRATAAPRPAPKGSLGGCAARLAAWGCTGIANVTGPLPPPAFATEPALPLAAFFPPNRPKRPRLLSASRCALMLMYC